MKIFDIFTSKQRVEEDSYIISKEKPLSYITESIQKIVLNLESANVDGELKVIQVTSTLPGEGKSTLLTNLAYLLTKNLHKVIILDLDFRKPRIHKIFNSPNRCGLIDYLVNDCTIEEATSIDQETNISYMVSGRQTNLITNILNSNKIKKLMEELKKTYDYVFLDTPPITSISDALYASKLSDGIIFTIAHNFAKKGLIKEALASLKQQNANIIGAVLTQDKQIKSRYNYNYYSQYEIEFD
jgi:capsular exopolysaccharide synthesis family protein